ncbi:uncharacterized protein LOC115630011 [Scaptodrosophila lebanonensis]|uniref:Uncharacterized protein LOC115630011 n=1 Tax=Drosophila lebanonensis TaxID=7225 RepID=A0A6J2U4R6_DROLE|nr:uncharacterized protein LOC115630011 [Scaptodrosophila lebanonensis]
METNEEKSVSVTGDMENMASGFDNAAAEHLDKTVIQTSTPHPSAKIPPSVITSQTTGTQRSRKLTATQRLKIEMDFLKTQHDLQQQRAKLEFQEKQNEMQRQLQMAQLEDCSNYEDYDDQNDENQAEGNCEDNEHIDDIGVQAALRTSL